MAVVFLFDPQKKLQRAVRDVEEIIHNEGEYSAVTMIKAEKAPDYGGFFGFKCTDGRFRLFLISILETSDETGIWTLTGTDAALAELDGKVLTRLKLQNRTAQEAIRAALNGTGWELGTAEKNGEVNTEDAYFATVWETLKTIASAGRVRIVPYYEFTGNEITGRKVDVQSKESKFSGLIYTRKKGANNISITEEGVPKGRVYGLGKIIGDTEPPEQVTFSDVVWSVSKGDPADKPAGQAWVELPGAVTDAAYVFEDKKETEPKRLLKKAFEDLQSRQKPKASGTANLNEMEHMPGYEHWAARMWMQVAVRMESGQTVQATITNIERYHVHRELTKITIGDENADDDTLESQLASTNALLLDTVKVAGGGSAGAGKAKVMVLEAEELIQLNSKKIEANAEQIKLRAFSADVIKLSEDVDVNFREVYLDINENRAEIGATQTSVNNISNEIKGINTTLTVQADQIAAKASQFEMDELGKRVTTAESQLIVQADQISAKASQFEMDELGERVKTAESEIKVASQEISTKVAKGEVISSINQTAESIKIQANRINLSGYVTADVFEAEMATIENIFAGYSEISALGINGNLYAKNANITDNLRIFNHSSEWKTGDFVTSVTFPSYEEAVIYYTNWSGEKVHQRVLTPVKRKSGSYAKSEDYPYLGH